MAPKAIVWDWDNTLFDSWETIHQGWNAVSRHFSRPEQTLEEIKAFAHRSCRDVFPEMFGERSQEAQDIFYEVVRKHQQMKLMPGAQDILATLKESGIKLGIVSNKEGHTLRHEVEQCGLAGLFDVIVGSGDVERDKPAPDGIHHALIQLKCEPTDIWFVGDTPVDVAAAVSAGCTAIVVHTPESCEPHKPHSFYATLAELKDVLQKTLLQEIKTLQKAL